MRRGSNGDEGLMYVEPVGNYGQPLFAPPTPVPTHQRSVGWAVALAVGLTLLVVGGSAAFFIVYQAKVSELSTVKQERDEIGLERAELRTDLAISHDELSDTAGRLARANAKLTNATKALSAAKKNLTKLKRDLVSANARAEASFSAGYSSGTSAGYSTGRQDGLVQGSDSLTCSDDPDVTWLPYCN